MAEVTYEVVPQGEKWHIVGTGPEGVEYVTREAAFEGVIAAAWINIKNGDEVNVHIRARPGADIV